MSSPSSPMNASSGRLSRMSWRIRRSLARSASVTTSTSDVLVAATSTTDVRRSRTSRAAARAAARAVSSRSVLHRGSSGSSGRPAQRRPVASWVGTAAHRAQVGSRSERPDGGALDGLAAFDGRPLEEQVTHHR